MGGLTIGVTRAGHGVASVSMTWRELSRSWAPDLAFGFVVFLVGLLEASSGAIYEYEARLPYVALAAGVALAVSTCRHLPAVGLLSFWVIAFVQVDQQLNPLLIEASAALVAFGCARWGRLGTVIASGLSIPLAAVMGIVLVSAGRLDSVVYGPRSDIIFQATRSVGDSWRIGAATLGITILGIPWFVGLVLRLAGNVRQSRISQAEAEADAARAMKESEQAREIARLQEAQASLAHDVHDVVGHSLAVILAQAESGPYLDDPDAAILNEKLRRTMATIAESARASLGDVRRVLVASRDQSVVVPPGGLDALIESIERSGQDIRSSVIGTPRPMPPELESVAYRVLQELLTNAMRHGRRDAPIWIVRDWAAELRLEVRNLMTDVPPGFGGLGVTGMQTRLESVGGRLLIAENQQTEGREYSATAWIPTRDETP